MSAPKETLPKLQEHGIEKFIQALNVRKLCNGYTTVDLSE